MAHAHATALRTADIFHASTLADEYLTAPDALDSEDKVNQTDKGASLRCAATRPPVSAVRHSPAAHVLIAALVEEMLSALREEVKEMDRNSWFYETQDPQVPMRVKI